MVSIRASAVLVAVLLVAGCGGGVDVPRPSAAQTTTAPAPSPTSSPSVPTVAPLGTRPPAWLGTRPLPRTAAGFGRTRPTPRALRHRRFTLPDRLPMLPGRGFAARIADPAPDRVLARSTWRPGCPVGAEELAWVRLAFWGYDDRRHAGELLVHRDVADDVVTVFRELYRARFPIEEMRVTRAEELDPAPTGDGNNTGAFVCRPVRGQTFFSQHAYGRAVDVNPFQNPYRKGEVVLPELASAYLDRERSRAGMILPGGAVTAAFARIGWGWGGGWRALRDYQHFSQNGR